MHIRAWKMKENREAICTLYKNYGLSTQAKTNEDSRKLVNREKSD